MNGAFNVLKAPGMTSHDVVDAVRRLTGEGRVGHAGTLDPAAAGVLPTLVGPATRLSEFLLDVDKSYRVEVTLGAASDTLDWTGVVVDVAGADGVDAARLAAGLASFRGRISQVPPMASAVRRGGRRLYEFHRRGIDVPRAPRTVAVHRLELVAFWPGRRARALLDVTCSRGTYVRSICADLGAALGCGGHMSFLVRNRVGAFALDDARTLQELSGLAAAGELGQALVAPRATLAHLAAVTVPPALAARIGRGEQPGRGVAPPEGIPAGAAVLLLDEAGEVLAVAVVADGAPPAGLRLRKVFAGAAERG